MEEESLAIVVMAPVVFFLIIDNSTKHLIASKFMRSVGRDYFGVNQHLACRREPLLVEWTWSAMSGHL